MLLASYQTMLETFGFVSPVLHYISSVMKVDLSLQREISSLLGMKEPLGGQHLQCMLDQMWVSLSSLSQFLSKKYLWKCHRSGWRRQSRSGICTATLIIWPNSEAKLIRPKTTSSLSCRNSDVGGRKINQPVSSLTL